MSKAIIKALEERQRQINGEGFTAEDDDQYKQGELVQAAVAYALAANTTGTGVESQAVSHWPWRADWWKPSSDPRRNIEKAMALLAAEHERLGRDIEKQLTSLPPTVPEIVWSKDDELFNYDDLQDVIENNDLETGATVYQGTTQRLIPTQFTNNIVELVVETMNVRAEGPFMAKKRVTTMTRTLKELLAEEKPEIVATARKEADNILMDIRLADQRRIAETNKTDLPSAMGDS
ncbi:hypothetical protein [Halomonas sp. KO116]|uniref:hypothetical protein n=1 Tax=Halomonas sp. KO116 TaxID=1504981 RepID=UPI0004E40507|nr:hypothetical protein [Halomonas sp. KO116]